MINRDNISVYRRKHFLFYGAAILCLFCYACKQDKAEKPLFELMNDTGIGFTNQIKDTKDFNIFTFRNFYNGAGVQSEILTTMDFQISFSLPIWGATNSI